MSPCSCFSAGPEKAGRSLGSEGALRSLHRIMKSYILAPRVLVMYLMLIDRAEKAASFLGVECQDKSVFMI